MCWISEFSCSMILVLASAPKIPYWSGPKIYNKYKNKYCYTVHISLIYEMKFNCPTHQDVKLTASNDDYYFVFEDFLYQVGSTLSQFCPPSLQIFKNHLSLFDFSPLAEIAPVFYKCC